jgi:hypothetical protein
MFYQINTIQCPWGDYGQILLTGMTSHLDRVKGRLQYERTGPFQPSVNLSSLNDLLVVDRVKKELEIAGIKDVEFIPVDFAHIVELNWLAWDKESDDPEFYPSTGEPEGYILDQPHSASLALKMEQVWEVIVPRKGSTAEGEKSFTQVNVFDISKPINSLGIVVSERVKRIIEASEFSGVEFIMI